MHNKKKLFANITKIILFSGSVILLGIIVKGYSSHIGLFENIDIQIKGNQFVSTAQIQKQLIPYISQSLLNLNLDDMQESISSINFIETSQISRVLPATLMIQIIENIPILLLTIDNEKFLMDENGALLSANESSISFFPVPVITISNDIENASVVIEDIGELFKYLLNDYTIFYDNLSEVIIDEEKWTFFSDAKTRIFATSEKLFIQINILKNFEQTVYPNRKLDDYYYIDLRVEEQIVVKEKNRKG